MRTLHIACLLLLAAGCLPAPPATQSGKLGSSGSNNSNNSSNSGGACGPVTAKGSCQASSSTPTVVLTCNNGQIVKDDCSKRGLVCLADSTSGAQCTSPATKANGSTGSTGSSKGGSSSPSTTGNGTQPCGSVTAGGTCDGNTYKWCFNSKLFTQDCTVDVGSTCKVSGSSATCTPGQIAAPPPSSTPTDCGDLTPGGTCDGNTYKWCSNSTPLSVDCGVDKGWTCKTSGSSATCVPPNVSGGGETSTTDPCNGLTFAGRCDSSTTLSWCSGGKPFTLDCTVDGAKECRTVDGNSDCYPVDTPTDPGTGGGGSGSGGGSSGPGECPTLKPGGQCNGNYTYVYCWNSMPQFIDCSGDKGWTCYDDGVNATCVPPPT
jgi:hypothetical protein